MKTWRWLLLLLLVTAGSAFADEHIVVSGGPSLRYFERHKAYSHDKFWGNFITAAEIQFEKIKPTLKPGDELTWMVYRPGYVTRGNEEQSDLTADIEQRAKKRGVKLVWFEDRATFVAYLNDNRRDGHLIARLEYFGHSNKRDWMFDYSNRLDGGAAEPAMFHIWNFHELDGGIFTDDAICKSWGCHSGEQYSGAWFKRTGRRMTGAIGKTDYSDGGLPFLSSKDGKWSE